MNRSSDILLQRLECMGFFALYSLLGDGNYRPYDWGKMAGQLTGEAQKLWQFFLLGTPLARSVLVKLVGKDALRFLEDSRLCHPERGGLSLGSFSLVTWRGAVFFIERGPAPRAYFGDDTKALMSLLPRRESGRCLCLYPNTGVAVLPAAAASHVDIGFSEGPHHEDVIRANLLLNRAGGRVNFERQAKAGYDLILAACPSTFEPPGVKMPAGLGGGRDGRKHLGKLLTLAAKSLTPEGTLFTTFLFFAENDSKAMRANLERFLAPSGLGWRLIVCSKHLMQPGIPVFNMLFTVAAANKSNTPGSLGPELAKNTEAVARKILGHVQTMHFEAGYLIKGRFFRQGSSPSREIIDFSDLYYGSWTF